MAVPTKTILETEVVGKTFEMAVCLCYDIPYQGPFKYSMDKAIALANRLRPSAIYQFFPRECVHTAAKGHPYDFTSLTDPQVHLSCKSSKITNSNPNLAPHSIGQASLKNFTKRMGIQVPSHPDPDASLEDVHEFTKIYLMYYIQSEDNLFGILDRCIQNTFDCPILLYNEKKDTIEYIQMLRPIDWASVSQAISWSLSPEEWGNSSSMRLGKTSVLEVQFHSRSRKNMAIRWNVYNLIKMFPNHFSIINLEKYLETIVSINID